MAERSGKKTPRDFLRIVLRRRKLFLLGASLSAIAVMVGAHGVQEKYTGTTVFVLSKDVAAAHLLARGRESFEAITKALQKELTGRSMIADVAEELDKLNLLEKKWQRDSEGNLTREGEMAKRGIIRSIKNNTKLVVLTQSTNIDRIAISTTYHDKKLAQRIPDTLVRKYKSRLLKQIKARLTESHNSLNVQINNAKVRLTEITNKRIEFEAKHAGMMPESPGALHELIQKTDGALDVERKRQNTAGLRIAYIHAQMNALKRTVATTLPTSRPSSQPADHPSSQPADKASSRPTSQPFEWVEELNPERKRLEEQLWKSEEQLDQALKVGGMTEKHPTIIMIRNSIARLKKRIESEPEWVEVRRVKGTGRSAAEALIAAHHILAAQADIAAAQFELQASTREIDRLQKKHKALVTLRRDFVRVRQDYVKIVEKVDENKDELAKRQKQLYEVQRALEAEVGGYRTRLTVLEVAQEQMLPSSPSLWSVLGIALVGGLAFGSLLVFLSNYLDRSIATTDDAIEHFDAPVHGVISEIVSRRQRVRRWLGRWVMWPIAAVILLAGLSVSGMSITLRLMHPQKYNEWKDSPIGFVSRSAADLKKEVWELF